MKASNRIRGSKDYYFATKLAEIKRMEDEGKSIINLGIGSPDLPPDHRVKTAMEQQVHEQSAFTYQSYRGLEGLRQATYQWYLQDYKVELGSDKDWLITHGSKEGLHFVLLAYLDEGDEVLIPDPGYPAYASGVKLAGGNAIPYDLTEDRDWYPDINQLSKSITSKTKALIINYPHMPTGGLPVQEKLSELLAFAKKHSLLIIHDNPYSHTLAKDPFSIFQMEDSHNCIELNSLSKSASMAGARVGFIVGRKALIEPVFTIQSSFSSGMFQPIQYAAIAALEQSKAYRESTNEIYFERKKTLQGLLSDLGCSFSSNSQGLFVWARIPESAKSGEAFSDEILQRSGVFMPPGMIFGRNGERYIRGSICSPIDVIDLARQRIKES